MKYQKFTHTCELNQIFVSLLHVNNNNKIMKILPLFIALGLSQMIKAQKLLILHPVIGWGLLLMFQTQTL